MRQVAADFEETGSFIAEESSDIAPPVAGRVISAPVDVGAHVRKGQVICELDHRDARLKLDQAKAQFEEATASVRQAQSRIGFAGGIFDPTKVPEVAGALASYQSALAQAKLAAADAQRYANLISTGDVSQSAYEKARTQQETAEAQANAARQQYEASANSARQSFEMVSSSKATLDSMRAQLAQAQKALDDTTIRAPFDGYVIARPIASGEYVALTSKIATVVDIETVKLDLQTPEQRAASAQVGDRVIARVAAFPDREFEGKAIAINPSVDPNSRAFIIEARFNNPDGVLKPGMFATARVMLPGAVDALFVPRAAVIRDKTTDSNQIFVAQNDRARLHVVSIGNSDDSTVVRVLSGVSPGDIVITSNQSDLYDGARIVRAAR
jgi:RND family efflux transporter MFP subunit